jgi:hypothetical protein
MMPHHARTRHHTEEPPTMRATGREGFLRTVDRIIPASVRARPVEWQAARNLTILAAITAVSAPLLTVMYHLLGYDAAGTVVLTAGVVMMTAPFALNAGAGIALARDLFIGALFVLKIWMGLHLGGVGAPTTAWFLLCPAVAMLLGGLRPALLWSALVGAAVLVLFALERGGALPAAHPVADMPVLQLVSVLALVALVTIIMALATGFAEVERRAR